MTNWLPSYWKSSGGDYAWIPHTLEQTPAEMVPTEQAHSTPESAQVDQALSLPDPNPPGQVNPLWIGAGIVGILLFIHFWPS